MNDNYTVDQLLLAVEGRRGNNRAFITRTMNAIRQEATIKTYNLSLKEQAQSNTLLQRLLRLPKVALMALIIAMLTTVAGTVYAAYRLWLQPEARVEHIQLVQDKLLALVSVRQCGSQDAQQTSRIIDPTSGLGSDDIAKVSQAYCEMNAISQWVSKDLRLGGWQAERFEHTEGRPVVFAHTIEAVHEGQIETRDSAGRQHVISLQKSTIFIDNATVVTKEALQPGDVITYVVKDHRKPQEGSTLAVITLDLAVKYYDSTYQQYVRSAKPCVGNEQDICAGPPWSNVYQSSEQSDRERPSKYRPGATKQVQGILRIIDQTGISIETSSGRVVTLEAVSAIRDYQNESKLPAPAVIVGTTLDVRYQTSADDLFIPSDKLVEINAINIGGPQ